MVNFHIQKIFIACIFILVSSRALAFDTSISGSITSNVVNIGDEFRVFVTIRNDNSGGTAFSPRTEASGLNAFSITSSSTPVSPSSCGFSNAGHNAYCSKSLLGPGESFTMTVVMTAVGPVGDYTIFASTTPSGTDQENNTLEFNVRVNTPPLVSINSPLDEAQFVSGSAVNFSGSASDSEDGDLSSQINWWSNLSGPLGTGAAPAMTLIDGRHIITASIVDTDGAASSQSIQINIGALNPLPATIQTIAGTGASGYTGDSGPAKVATFNNINSSTRTPQGEIFVIDSGNDVLRKIDATGDVTTILSGQLYQNIAYITHDSSGNIYWYSFDSNRILKRDTNGVVSTFAGGCCTPQEGMDALNANLDDVTDFVISPQGEMYFTTFFQHQVFRIATDGIIHLVAGNGVNNLYPTFGQPAATQPISYPSNLAVDSVGNIYISQNGTFDRVLKVDTSGILTLYAGSAVSGFSGDMGPANLSTLDFPTKLMINGNDELLIKDGNRIRIVDNAGIINTIYGNGINEISGDGGFAAEAGIGMLLNMEMLNSDEVLLSHSFQLRQISTTAPDVDLSVTAAGNAIIQQGDNSIVTFTMSNNTGGPVENVFLDLASSNSLTISGMPAALCSPAAMNIRCHLPSFNTGGTTTVDVIMPSNNTGLNNITATASSYYNELTPLDNETIFQYTVNTPPSLTIVTPADAAVFSDDGGAITLTATALDAEDGDLSPQVQWSSNLDGAIVSPATLAVGSHQITASVIDSGSQLTTAIVNIEVLVSALDNDSDNMPNGWEIANGLNPLDSADAIDNPDGDALNNIQEYLNGSDPNVIDNILGDINNDGQINAADILLIQRHVIGSMTLDEFSVARGDLYPAGTGDGQLTMSDMILLSNLVLN